MMYLVAALSLFAVASASVWAPHPVAWAPHAPIHHFEPAPLAHDGQVIDTADVAHAKAEHFAAHAKANAAVAHGSHGWAPAAHGWAPAPAHGWAPAAHVYAPAAHGWAPAHEQPKWHGPIAHIELTHDGKYVKDTPEVAHARAAHLVAHAEALHKAHSADHYAYGPAYGHGHGHW